MGPGVVSRALLWTQWHQAWIYGDEVTLEMPSAMPTPHTANSRNLSLPLPLTQVDASYDALPTPNGADWELFGEVSEDDIRTLPGHS